MKILYINTPIYDYLTATLIEGLNELGHAVFCTENSNYAKVVISQEDFFKTEKQVDLVVLGACWSDKQSYAHKLVDQLSNKNIVIVDGLDSQFFQDFTNVQARVYFKRELSLYLNAPNLFALPFAAEKRYFQPIVNKALLMSFIANMKTNTERQTIFYYLKSLNNPNIITGTTRECAYAEGAINDTPKYFKLMANSLMSVNVPGAGIDCARYWESIALQCCLFTKKLDIQIPNPFTDGVNIVEWTCLDEFHNKLFYYLKNLDEVRKIAANGYQHLLQYHTTKARAQYFIEKAQEIISANTYVDMAKLPKY